MISINWATRVINIPKADLTPIGGILYELDVNWFRLQLKGIEDSPEGMSYPDTHRHNTEIVLSGVTYARFVEIINGYTVSFEDTGTHYTVRCVGANHNLADVLNFNSVNLIISNSAGLQTVSVGSGLSPTEQAWLQAVHRAHFNKRDVSGNLIRIYDLDGTTVLYEFTTDPTFSHVTPV